MKKKIPPLIVDNVEENHNLFLLSVVEYRRTEYVCIIDNITQAELRVYIIDQHHPEALSTEELISEAIHWYYHASALHQFSVYLASKELAHLATPLLRTFDINGVSRVVGKAFHFPGLTKVKVKRRKVLPIQEGIPIFLKKSVG